VFCRSKRTEANRWNRIACEAAKQGGQSLLSNAWTNTKCALSISAMHGVRFSERDQAARATLLSPPPPKVLAGVANDTLSYFPILFFGMPSDTLSNFLVLFSGAPSDTLSNFLVLFSGVPSDTLSYFLTIFWFQASVAASHPQEDAP
jgi:hypothetical protein